MSSVNKLTLNNGKEIPILGYGTWQAPDHEVELGLEEALEAGYRHIDCAPVYLNEKAIGRVLNKWIAAGKVKREELFITTKLGPTANRPEDVEETLKRSLADLQLDYIDLYLIHCPFTLFFGDGDIKREENGNVVLDKSTDHNAVWQKFEELQNKGFIKSIGISNFNQKQIERLLQKATIKPAVLQIEHHVYLQQRNLIDYCKANNIVVTAYAPLGSKGIAILNKDSGIDRELPDLMDIAVVKDIAAVHGKKPAQVLLRWIIQSGITTIPKSTNPGRLRENFNIFDFQLSEEEMQKLNGLDANIRVCDFAFFHGVEQHPEFPF